MSKNIQVGEPVVCIKSHEGVKEGSIYTAEALMRGPCGCILIDVGIKEICATRCTIHNRIINVPSGIHWYYASRFKPIDKLSEEQVDEILDSILQEKETVK